MPVSPERRPQATGPPRERAATLSDLPPPATPGELLPPSHEVGGVPAAGGEARGDEGGDEATEQATHGRASAEEVTSRPYAAGSRRERRQKVVHRRVRSHGDLYDLYD